MNISLFRSIASQYRDLRRVNTVAMMSTISHQIEDQIAQHQLPVDLYVGFQRFSNFVEQFRRYSRLGAICKRVFVFGVADCQLPSIPGIEFVEISPTSSLANEWFVLVNTHSFWTALVAKELDDPDPATSDRRFDAIWSFNEHVVERVSLLVAQILEFSYLPVQKRDHDQQNGHISEMSSRVLNLLEQAELNSQRRWIQLRTLQLLTEASNKQPNHLLHSFAQTLHTVFGAASVMILLNHADGYYSVAAVEGEITNDDRKISIPQGLIGRAIQQRKLVQIKDVDRSHEREPLFPTAKALIAAPIMNRQIHGAIVVGNTEPREWNDEDGQTMLAVARILAIKLEQIAIVQQKSKSFPEVSRYLHRVVTEQQRPTARLLALQQKLRVIGGLTPTQLKVLDEMAIASANLVQTIQHAKHVLPIADQVSQ